MIRIVETEPARWCFHWFQDICSFRSWLAEERFFLSGKLWKGGFSVLIYLYLSYCEPRTVNCIELHIKCIVESLFMSQVIIRVIKQYRQNTASWWLPVFSAKINDFDKRKLLRPRSSNLNWVTFMFITFTHILTSVVVSFVIKINRFAFLTTSPTFFVDIVGLILAE